MKPEQKQPVQLIVKFQSWSLSTFAKKQWEKSSFFKFLHNFTTEQSSKK